MARKEHGTVGAAWGEGASPAASPWPGTPQASACPGGRGTGIGGFSPKPGFLQTGYFESCSSLAFCRIWQTSVMG